MSSIKREKLNIFSTKYFDNILTVTNRSKERSMNLPTVIFKWFCALIIKNKIIRLS